TLFNGGLFDNAKNMTTALINGLVEAAQSLGVPLQADSVGTMFGFYFLKTADAVIHDYASAKQHAHTERYAKFFHAMLERGVYLAPSQFEAGFLSSAHTMDDVQTTILAAHDSLTYLLSI
ncbi:partial Glutamate-1-semialdehyde 2,1-aminomutase, partial [Anaerolineae bacterium]